jgi:hypothetical protein
LFDRDTFLSALAYDFSYLSTKPQALREVGPEDLTDDVLERLYASGDEILLILQRARKRLPQPGVGS